MFQRFEDTSRREDGAPRLAALRDVIRTEGLDGFLVPRADLHQGEYVADRDARLAWLTGFTGSAGFCCALLDRAGVFIDGRYRVQVKDQVDLSVYTPVPWPETTLESWLIDALPDGGRIGYDAWLHTHAEVLRLQKALGAKGISLQPCDNLVDRVWEDQPPAPTAPVEVYPKEFAGRGDEEKRAWLAERLTAEAQDWLVLTLPDSLCWLLNIRGADLPRVPVVQACALFSASGKMQLFIDPDKVTHLGPDPAITVRPMEDFAAALANVTGVVLVDPTSAPQAVFDALAVPAVTIVEGDDPCQLEKACKTEVEIASTRAAHLRDGAAVVRFLAWLDAQPLDGGLTEIDVVHALEGFRRETNQLRDISFDTISGAGPNGAIVHYRVTERTNRVVGTDTLLLVDSGGQYLDGTTDITRTLLRGTPPPGAVEAFTRVMQGMIAVSRARWPVGLAGRDLDALARAPLWIAGQDYDHGTGHGVGQFLSVHEGPQRISRASNVPLRPGMILSNEPGYYREGAWGIRIENLVVVREADPLPDGDARKMLDFETLTYVPIDRRLVNVDLFSPAERAWLNGYHADVLAKIAPLLTEPDTIAWLEQACAPV